MEQVDILEVSSSKNTIKIDIGTFEHIKENQSARFIFQESISRPRIFNIGKAEAVKVFDNYSIWYFKKMENSSNLQEGRRILMVRADESVKGRRKPLVIKERKVILPGKVVEDTGVEQAVEDSLSNVPDSLVLKKDLYEESDELVDANVPKQEDMEVIEFDEWNETEKETPVPGFVDEVNIKEMGESESVWNKEKIRKEEMEHIFDSTLDGSMEKINRSDGLDAFYSDQKKDKDILSIKDKKFINSVYDAYVEKKMAEKNQKSEEKDHPMWSKDISDDDLRRRYSKQAISKEEHRRRLLKIPDIDNEIFLRFQQSFINHTSQNSFYNQGHGNLFEIGYEYHILKTIQNLSSLSIGVFTGSGVGHYHLGNDINARSSEKSIGMAVNWYVYNLPYMFKKYIFYMGSGFRLGWAKMDSEDLSRTYNYHLRSFPSFHTGMKYRWKTKDKKGLDYGIGMSFLLSLERINLGFDDVVSTSDNISGLISIIDLKFSAGLDFLF